MYNRFREKIKNFGPTREEVSDHSHFSGYSARMARPKSVLLEDRDVLVPKTSSKAFTKIKQVNARQRKYAELRAEGMPVAAASRAAGFKGTGSMKNQLETDNRIQELIAKTKAQVAEDLKMTRKQVLEGFLEAIDIGRTMQDPHAMVKGWTEIGKMCGYYAPEVKNIHMSISAKRLVDKFETMSDEELLRLAEKTIDGTFTEVQEAPKGRNGHDALDSPVAAREVPTVQ